MTLADGNPRLKARIAGGLYLCAMTAAFAFAVRAMLVVRGDAAATAQNIASNQPLLRLGFVADLFAVAAYLGVTALLYELLKPVNRAMALTAALFSVAGVAISAVNLVSYLAPLFLLSGADYLSGLEPSARETLAYAFLTLQGVGVNIATTFFGGYCLLTGCLILGASFLPRALGFLMALAGLCYLVYTLTYFLAPTMAPLLYPYILAPPLLGEGGLALWLLVFGVNEAKWQEQTSASRAARSNNAN